jgi:diketogulonate reductase-like aldo/keto reductase
MIAVAWHAFFRPWIVHLGHQGRFALNQTIFQGSIEKNHLLYFPANILSGNQHHRYRYDVHHDDPKNTFTTNDTNTTVPRITIGMDVHEMPVRMPLFGAGTWQYNDTIAYQSVCQAFSVGVTLVDTAFGYGNEQGVGKAIRDCYTGKRSDLFVLTKVPGGLTFSETLAAHHHNLFALNLEYVDHLMVHYPADWEASPDKSSKSVRQAEWRALEEIYYSGKARSIGVSHYCRRHLQDILEIATVLPSLNQVEYHVGSQDVDQVIPFCKEHNITFMSFSPLCGPCTIPKQDSLIDGDLVTEIASHYSEKNVTGSQVALRFIVQQALEEPYMGGVIPKSNNLSHIRSNMDIFRFQLTNEDMDRLRQATRPAKQC